MMDFIRDVHESRMTKGDSTVSQLTYVDCCERMYILVLAMCAMYHYPEYRSRVERYARGTASIGRFAHYRISGTDLYNLIYFVYGSDEALSKLKNPNDARTARSSIQLPKREIDQILAILSGRGSTEKIFPLLAVIERNLKIKNTDYKGLRRWISDFDKIKNKDRQLVVTRILYAVRAKLRSVDFSDDISKWAVDKNLETRASDPEPVISSPDVRPQDQTNYALYRYLTDVDDLSKVKMFVEHARSGKHVSSSLIRSYLPIIEMVDDIVRSGPAHMNMLKEIHRRALNSPKK